MSGFLQSSRRRGDTDVFDRRPGQEALCLQYFYVSESPVIKERKAGEKINDSLRQRFDLGNEKQVNGLGIGKSTWYTRVHVTSQKNSRALIMNAPAGGQSMMDVPAGGH
jgi:hypothetical protein